MASSISKAKTVHQAGHNDVIEVSAWKLETVSTSSNAAQNSIQISIGEIQT